MTARPLEILTLERVPTPIGTALVVTDESDVLRAFNWTDYEPAMTAWIRRRYPQAKLEEGRGPMRGALEAYFAGQTDALAEVAWEGVGTSFQRTVWATLCRIPAGQTWSYAKLAQAIGQPTAVRAVGIANGSNPVALIVPCHRVIGSNGSLTGYGGGLHRKRWLLEHEGVFAATQLSDVSAQALANIANI